ncbi:hypothetical protein RIEGSTA812A_PEG_721 [invertebrate metagenome]|uniref:Uncharacterized protein n=1 Tax=invertebrate metagenome TaxID=1711999 RepID=A0A484HAT9_9ZZZZ
MGSKSLLLRISDVGLYRLGVEGLSSVHRVLEEQMPYSTW